jgi:hypothetical protein
MRRQRRLRKHRLSRQKAESPLTDSNRRPPPYHRGHGWARAVTFFLQIEPPRRDSRVRACLRVSKLMYPSRTRGSLSTCKTGNGTNVERLLVAPAFPSVARSGAQIGQHRAHAAMVVRDSLIPSFMKMCLTCASTVFGLRKSCAQIALFERPSAIRASTSRSRSVSTASCLAGRARLTRRATIVGSITHSSSRSRIARRSGRRGWRRAA